MRHPLTHRFSWGTHFFNHLTDTSDFWRGRGEELLMSDTRADRHDPHLLDVLQDFLQYGRGGCRVDDHAHTFAPAS